MINNKTIMKKLFILAAVAASFTACSFDKDLGESASPTAVAEKVPLTIGYSMNSLAASNSVTRGNVTDIQDNFSINTTNDTKVGLFVFKQNGVNVTDNSYEKFNITSTAANHTDVTNYSVLTYSGLNYPDAKEQEIDIYAYAPSVETATVTAQLSETDFTNISTQVIKYTLQSNQTTDASYLASDILWGCAGTGNNISSAVTNTTTGPYYLLGYTDLGNNSTISANKYKTVKTNGTGAGTHTSSQMVDAYYLKYDGSTPNTNNEAYAVVPLLHRASKVIVKLHTSGMDLAKLKNATVKINVDHVEGSLNVSTGAFTASGAVSAQDVILTDRLGIANVKENESDPEPTQEGYITEGTINKFTCAAVIVPQDITSRALIKIDLYEKLIAHTTDSGSANPPTATYVYTGSQNFLSGKKYIYDITVTATGLVVATNVQNWVEGQTVNDGTANLQ